MALLLLLVFTHVVVVFFVVLLLLLLLLFTYYLQFMSISLKILTTKIDHFIDQLNGHLNQRNN